MNDLAATSSIGHPPAPLPLPQPRYGEIVVRPGTMEDLPFIDELQKVHRKQVGFLKRVAIEGKIKANEVLIAESAGGAPAARVGYIIFADRYFKRDDVGIVYQLNVAPGKQRGFVGAILLKAAFDRSAYGCKLFCCWCAQDITANRFWEAMGFVPLAYRAGSERKRRLHIFWQKRIRSGDVSTPWWFPSHTTGGALAEARLALPIPPERHWSDGDLPVILPTRQEQPKLEGPKPRQTRTKPAEKKPRSLLISDGGMKFDFAKPEIAPAKLENKPREKKPKAKNDPRLVAAAREVNARWMDHINAGGAELIAQAKYDVARTPGTRASEAAPAFPRLLPAA